MEKLNKEQIEKQLKEVENWSYEDNAIHISLEFEDFKSAFAVMTRIAFEAEEHQHHPDWSNVYNTVNISLSTHDAGGLTEKDFKLAKSIDEILGQ